MCRSVPLIVVSISLNLMPVKAFDQQRRFNIPFGGLQLVLSGDFSRFGSVSSGKFSFQSGVWQSMTFAVQL
jgi:hypothetical protein